MKRNKSTGERKKAGEVFCTMSKPRNVYKERERHQWSLEGNDAIARFTDSSAPWDGWSAQAEQLGLKEANSSCRERTRGRESLGRDRGRA